jgi:hypothetical protein
LRRKLQPPIAIEIENAGAVRSRLSIETLNCTRLPITMYTQIQTASMRRVSVHNKQGRPNEELDEQEAVNSKQE